MGFPRAVSHWYELVIYRWRNCYYQGLIRMNLFWRFRSRISVAGAKRSRLTPNGWLLCPRPCTRFRAGSQVVDERKFLNRLLGAINVTCVVLPCGDLLRVLLSTIEAKVRFVAHVYALSENRSLLSRRFPTEREDCRREARWFSPWGGGLRFSPCRLIFIVYIIYCGPGWTIFCSLGLSGAPSEQLSKLWILCPRSSALSESVSELRLIGRLDHVAHGLLGRVVKLIILRVRRVRRQLGNDQQARWRQKIRRIEGRDVQVAALFEVTLLIHLWRSKSIIT